MTKLTSLVLLSSILLQTSSLLVPTLAPRRSLHFLTSHSRPTFVTLQAKKKKKKARGKGFSKSPSPVVQDVDVPSETPEEESTSDATPLESITPRASDTASFVAPKEKEIEIDPELPVEERTAKILREKYGMRSYEEQKSDQKDKDMAQKMTSLGKKADQEKDFDIFAKIPAPVLVFIDRFLKVGLTLSIIVFVAEGLGITVEAWSHVSGDVLPENVDNFLVNVVEPYFTPTLGVLFSFSISLGVFSAAQLGSDTSQYKED